MMMGGISTPGTAYNQYGAPMTIPPPMQPQVYQTYPANDVQASQPVVRILMLEKAEVG